jgi:putative transposase
LVEATRRRRLLKDRGDRQLVAVPANLLNRQFEAEQPNQKWIADFTLEGWLYVAAVIDQLSRRVVGWSMSATMGATGDQRPRHGRLAPR